MGDLKMDHVSLVFGRVLKEVGWSNGHGMKCVFYSRANWKSQKLTGTAIIQDKPYE